MRTAPPAMFCQELWFQRQILYPPGEGSVPTAQTSPLALALIAVADPGNVVQFCAIAGSAKATAISRTKKIARDALS
jgi:hypothetical protein